MGDRNTFNAQTSLILTASDPANRKMGHNRFRAEDQSKGRNRRPALSRVEDTDGKIESLEKLNEHARAEPDTGKGQREKAVAPKVRCGSGHAM